MSMYRCDDLCPSNEELALRIQDGDPQAAPLLLSQNEGYLTMLAVSYYVPPQTTWVDEKELTERFLCEVVSLIHVHEIFSDALEQETE